MTPLEVTLFFSWVLFCVPEDCRGFKKYQNAVVQREWAKRNPAKKKISDALSYLKHRVARQKSQKAWTKNNIEESRKIKRRYYEKNKEGCKKRALQHNQSPEGKAYVKRWTREKLDADLAFKIRHQIASRIWHALQTKSTKSARTKELLGCSVSELKIHLETKFVPGMIWENYGPSWHIDHIRPCISFDLTSPEQQKQCFHYSNLQPLWAKDNLSKGAKWQ